MLSDLLKNIKFRNEIKRFHNKNKKEILDIILFGSAIRGKEKPKDIDILILFKERENLDLSYELRKSIKKIGLVAEITGKTYKNLLSVKFLPREDILSDGYSLVLNKKLSESFGYNTFMLFRYSLKGFSQSQRMMFYYALEGRRKKDGMLKILNGIKFTNSVVLIPIENSEEFENFLKNWKMEIKKTRILIPEKTIKYMKF